METPELVIRRVSPGDIPIKLLLYGNPGAGKTTLAASALSHPALSPALWLDFEGGLLSVAGRGDIDAVNIQTITELEAAYWHLYRKTAGWEHFKTVIIDSASELYSKALAEAVEKRVRTKGGTLDFVDRGDYGTAGFQTHRLFRMFRDLPDVNIIATAHARFEYPNNSDGKTTQPIDVVPSFPNKLSQQMQGIFDFVWYLYTFTDEDGTSHRSILTHDHGAYKAKTRGHHFPVALGSPVNDPSLAEIYDLLQRADGQGGAIQEPPPAIEPVVIPEPSEQMAMTMEAENPFSEPKRGASKKSA